MVTFEIFKGKNVNGKTIFTLYIFQGNDIVTLSVDTEKNAKKMANTMIDFINKYTTTAAKLEKNK